MKRARPFPLGFERWPRSSETSPLGYDYGYFEGSAFRGEMYPVVPDDGGLLYWTGHLWRVGDEDKEHVFEVRGDDPWSVAADLVAFATEAAA